MGITPLSSWASGRGPTGGSKPSDTLRSWEVKIRLKQYGTRIKWLLNWSPNQVLARFSLLSTRVTCWMFLGREPSFASFWFFDSTRWELDPNNVKLLPGHNHFGLVSDVNPPHHFLLTPHHFLLTPHHFLLMSTSPLSSYEHLTTFLWATSPLSSYEPWPQPFEAESCQLQPKKISNSEPKVKLIPKRGTQSSVL